MISKQFVIIVSVTFVVIILWIIADIIHTRPSVPINPKLETLLTPINPNFDQKVISQIKEIQPLNQQEKPVPTPRPTQTASSSAITQPIATQGGTLR